VGRSSANDPGILALIWLVLLITILVVNQLLNPRQAAVRAAARADL
jgi:hypothetical protein